MVLRFYPSKDATLYERYPSKNTGLDSSLEISKEIVGTTLSSSIYNSRILVSFPSSALDEVRANGLNPGYCTWTLKLYASETSEIPSDYTLYAYLLSQSWAMGVGKKANTPPSTEGVSWKYRTSLAVTSSAWDTGSYGATETGSWTTNPGGSVWHTDTVATHSYQYDTADLRMNVNTLMAKWLGGEPYRFDSFINFIVKKSDEDEQSGLRFNSVKFFSTDTSTVFMPVLEVGYDDSISTGSLPAIDPASAFSIVPINLQDTYSESATSIIRFAARPRYPARSFTTSSVYLDRYIVSGSQYAIQSAQSDDMIIDFSPYTKVSADNQGNYIKLHMGSFQPERFYKLLIKVPNSGSYGYQVFDGQWIFKVLRTT